MSPYTVRRGLNRISAVFWGWWILLGGATAIGVAGTMLVKGKESVNDGNLLICLGAGGAVFAYLAHKVTCWVINGFFSESQHSN